MPEPVIRTTLPAKTTRNVITIATRVNRRMERRLLWKGSCFCKMRHLNRSHSVQFPVRNAGYLFSQFLWCDGVWIIFNLGGIQVAS